MEPQNIQNQDQNPLTAQPSLAPPPNNERARNSRRKLFIIVIICVVLVASACAWWFSQNSANNSTTPQPAGNNTQKSEPKLTITVLEKGEKILPNGHADPTVVKIDDGYRMYVNRQGGGQTGVLIYKSADGITWQQEKDIILPGVSTSRAVTWPGGGVRIYYPGPMPIKPTDPQANMYSSFSQDGLTFTKDPGVVLESKNKDFYVEGPTVFQLPNKTWRMYFNENSVAAGTQRDGIIWGASSEDGVAWQRDEVPTLQADDTEIAKSNNPGAWSQVLHPFVVKHPSGGYIMFYNSHSEIFAASSDDGLIWKKLGKIGIHGADADGYFQADGTFRMYYGDFTEATGGLVYTAVLKITK